MKPKCVKFVSFIRQAYICLAEDKEEGFNYAEESELEIISGYCKDCIKKFALDSIKGSNWELKY